MQVANTLRSIRQRSAPILRKYGVRRAAVFGSFARGEEKKKSDVDMLVDVPSGTGLFTFIGLQNALADRLGRAVDLVTYRSLHPYIREQVLKERVAIYGKQA